MTLKKNFLSGTSRSKQIPKNRVIIGFGIGAFFAFAVYCVSYTTREAIRLLSLTSEYDMWILSTAELNFYNLFYAFISLTIGQYICLAFWLDRPRKFKSKLNRERLRNLHFVRFGTLTFLFPFIRVASLLAVFLGLTIPSGFRIVNFYKEYREFFILFSAVMFIIPWHGILRSEKVKGLKWMLYSTVLISTLAFALSKFHVIDHEIIEKAYFDNNVYENYNLTLPQLDRNSEYRLRNSHTNQHESIIHIVKSKNPEERQPVLIFNRVKIDRSKLDDVLEEWRRNFSENEMAWQCFELFIDKSTKMKYVNQITAELNSFGFNIVSFSYLPSDPQFNAQYYSNHKFTSFNWDWTAPKVSISWKRAIVDCQNDSNCIAVKPADFRTYYFNDHFIEAGQLKAAFYEIIKNNPNYRFIYFVNDQTNFENHLSVLASHRAAINSLKNTRSISVFDKPYNNLGWENSLVIDKLCRAGELIQVTEDMMEQINSEYQIN